MRPRSAISFPLLYEKIYDRAPTVDKIFRVLPLAAGSSQETIRHTGDTTYRCFLPDLTEFVARPLRRAQLSAPLTMDKPQKTRPRAGIQPRYSGLRVQGTASSPSSTIKLTRNNVTIISGSDEYCQSFWSFIVPTCNDGLLTNKKGEPDYFLLSFR